MSTINNSSHNCEQLAVLVPGLGAVLSASDKNAEPRIRIVELVALSTITQTPIDEILKNIDFPYLSI